MRAGTASQDPLRAKDLGLATTALTPRREQRHLLAHLALRTGTALRAPLQA
jgi:hypothetical protein